jgi:Ribonuclease G/E
MGLGRIYSPETIVMRIERWFARAKAGSQYRKFRLKVNPTVSDILTADNNRKLKDICRRYRFKIDLDVDEHAFQEDYSIFSIEENLDITEFYKTKAEINNHEHAAELA